MLQNAGRFVTLAIPGEIKFYQFIEGITWQFSEWEVSFRRFPES